MQGETKKKKSLFSQRIKQARQEEDKREQASQQPSSFPKALNINIGGQEQGQRQYVQELRDKSQRVEGKKFVERILSGALKEEEIRKIQSENMESIRNMSEEDVKKYQDMLVKQMPQEFINKFKKGTAHFPSQSRNEEMGSKRIAGKLEQEQIQEEKIENKIQNQSSQGQQAENTGSLGSLQPILMDIYTHELSYNYLSQEMGAQSRVITMRALKQMIENQNNQTQIIGSKLLWHFCDAVFKQTEINRYIPLFCLSNQNFHLIVLACDVYQYLIRSLIHQISKTKFKSCWVQMMDALAKSIQITSFWLRKAKQGTKMMEATSSFIKGQLEKKSHFLTPEKQEVSSQNSQLLLKNWQEAAKCGNHPQQGLNEASITGLAGHSKQVVELIVVEQLESLVCRPVYHFSTLLQNVSFYSNTLHDKTCQRQLLISFIYPIAQELLLREYRSNNMDKEVMALKEVVYGWLTHQLSAHLLSTLDNQKWMTQAEEAWLFKCLYITKILAPNEYSSFLTGGQQCQQFPTSIFTCSQLAANLLTLLNIEQYFCASATIHNSSERQSQIQNIERMLCFVTDKLSQPKHRYLRQVCACLMVKLMVIFLNYLDLSNPNKQNHTKLGLSYHDLNEQVLNTTLSAVASTVVAEHQEKKLSEMVSSEKMKSLIQSYNYNSFGSYCFSRLLLFLAAVSPPNTEAMIIEEVIGRYPFLFCYAAEGGVYGPDAIYLGGGVLPQMASVHDMVQFNCKFPPGNLVLRYLSKR